jgi:hypothetical protein
MTPHQDLVNWSHRVHERSQDSDLDDAASFAIEQYLPREKDFHSDASTYSFLNICLRRKYKDEKIKRKRTVSIESSNEPDDSEDTSRLDNINFVRQLVKHLPHIYKQVLLKSAPFRFFCGQCYKCSTKCVKDPSTGQMIKITNTDPAKLLPCCAGTDPKNIRCDRPPHERGGRG